MALNMEAEGVVYGRNLLQKTKVIQFMTSRKVYSGRLSKAAFALWCAFLLWVVFVCCLSSLSASRLTFVPHLFEGFDKVIHSSLFSVGSVFLTLAVLETTHLSWGTVLVISMVALSLFGWGDEVHQLFTSGRSGADFGDWLADFFGTTAGSVFALFLWRKMFFPESVGTTQMQKE
jgi:VanZ family protein